MRKSNQILAAIALTVGGVFTTVNAQNSSDSSSSDAHFGVKGGVNFSNLISDEVTDNNVLTSFNAGVYFNMPIGDRFSFQPEVLYSRKGAELKYDNFFATGSSKFKLNYIEVPVLIKANITENLNVHFGPYLAYLIDAKATNETANGTFDFEKEFSNDDFNKFDAGLSGGIGFDFDAFGIGVRYNYGLTKIGKERTIAGQTFTTPDAKNSSLSVYAAIKL